MRYFIGLLFILFLLGIGLYGYGANLPKDHTNKVLAEYHQPVEKVWERITNYPAVPTWSKDIERVEQLPELDGNPVWRFYPKHGDVMDIAIIRNEKPSVFIGKLVNNNSISGTWTYQLRQNSSGSTEVMLTEDAHIKSAFLRAICQFMGGDAVLKQHLKDIGASFGETTEVK